MFQAVLLGINWWPEQRHTYLEQAMAELNQPNRGLRMMARNIHSLREGPDDSNSPSLRVGDSVRAAASWDPQHITGDIMKIDGDRAHVFWYRIDTASWCKLKDLKRA